MSKLIALSINVSKIDKTKLIAGKNGSYLNLTVSLNDTDDAYGNNVSCWEGQSKEEREAKEDRNFLGNGKVVFDGDKGSQSSKPTTKKEKEAFQDLPF